MNTTELILFWSGTLLLAVSFAAAILRLFFDRTCWVFISKYGIICAFCAITILGVVRWVVSGHPPFVTKFESMVISVWFILFITLIISLKKKNPAGLTVPVSFFTFLMLGWAASLPGESSPLSAALSNVWLFIHASFATAGAACALVAASFAVLYLMFNRGWQPSDKLADKLTPPERIPEQMLMYQLLGFIFWGVMIVSGSIWAHNAWGRYWAWDPIETWSLISWLLFGLVLHVKLTLRFSKTVFAVLTIVTALTVVFSLWGIGYIYETIHNYG